MIGRSRAGRSTRWMTAPARPSPARPGFALLALLLAVPLLAVGLGPSPLAAQGSGPPALPEGAELARVIDHPERDEVEIVVGPVELPADGGHLRLPIQLVSLPISGWLHGFEWEMRDAAGRPLPERTLHHVNLIDPDRRELFGPVARRVMAAGRETRRQDLPRLLGYPVEAGTRLLIVTMFANATDRDLEGAYLHVTLFYSTAEERRIEPRPVFPFYLDVMGFVGPKSFSLPPGRHGRAWEGSPAIDARILAIGGHVHDYATSLRLIDLTEGKTIWEGEPQRDERGRVSRLPSGRLWWRGGVRIHRDHVYRIEVEYHNPTDRPAPDGGMGAIGGVVLASGNVEWPPLDRHDQAYVEDLRNTLEEPFRGGGHGHGEGHAGGGERSEGGEGVESDGADGHGTRTDEDDHGGGATDEHSEHGGGDEPDA